MGLMELLDRQWEGSFSNTLVSLALIHPDIEKISIFCISPQKSTEGCGKSHLAFWMVALEAQLEFWVVQSSELDLMVLLGPFHFRIALDPAILGFHDSVLLSLIT